MAVRRVLATTALLAATSLTVAGPADAELLPRPAGAIAAAASEGGVTARGRLLAPVIRRRPADPTARRIARFTFSHPERGVTLHCRLDRSPRRRCTSPVTYGRLAAGAHVFGVTVTRPASGRSATASHRWEVDRTPPPAPVVTLRPDRLTSGRGAEIRFRVAEAGVRLSCRLDAAPARRCRSPYRHPADLADGPHRFSVRARDAAGNDGPVRTFAWTIDATPPPAPVIADAPAATTGATSARLAFSVAEPGVRFSCSLDHTPADACRSPVEHHDLQPGAHAFAVTARDAAGNASRTRREWSIVLAPDVTTGPPVTVQSTSATLAGTVAPRGQAASVFVEYGLDTTYGRSSQARPVAPAAGDVPAEALVTGLAPATTYHYRLVASTCGGCARGTRHGADRMFATPPARTYQNPVYGGIADPGGFPDQGDYYVYGTGDGFPAIHSTDLVDWTRVGLTLPRRPAWVPASGDWHPWAPSVIRRDGPCPGAGGAACFVMYYTGLSATLSPATHCIGVATSEHPSGPFADAGILTTDPPSTDASGLPIGCGDVNGNSNIDPAPFVDPVTGQAYLYVSTGRQTAGPWPRALSVIPLDGDLVHSAGPRAPLLSMSEPWERDVVEAPWLIRRWDRYYLLYSGGRFTDASYGMGYAVADTPTGPFTKPTATPILATTPEVEGPGGGTVVVGPAGGDWLLYHGRAAAGGARTLRVDPVVWDESVVPPALRVRGPTTSPQPLP
jgi:hypothetical protein